MQPQHLKHIRAWARQIDWRDVLARIPVPLLALSAAYGVYEFNSLFVPAWVALISAAAFEATYCGLALARLDPSQRPRARQIAIAAVIVSILYNAAGALFHLRPDLLAGRPLWLDVALAVLHGVPLAVVAYATLDLLHHAPTHDAGARQDPAPAIAPPPVPAPTRRCPACAAPLTQPQFAAAVRYGGCPSCKGGRADAAAPAPAVEPMGGAS